MDDAGARASFETHADHLRGLGYRMLGSVADAEDLVQDTFVRLLERPPPDTEASLRPWLTRVAVNLARDRLRARRRRDYPGTWLPAPAATPEPGSEPGELAGPAPSPESRYDRIESMSYAFLLALEELGPTQRAVLVLRDVLDHSVRETAEMLDLSESNVKTTHHRARRAMATHDARRTVPLAERRRLARAALERFVELVARGDADGLVELLRDDVVGLSDGGGVYPASRLPIVGARKLARTQIKLSEKYLGDAILELCWMNGMPALRIEHETPVAGHAPRVIVRIETDEHGRIRELHSILSPDKLTTLAGGSTIR